MRTRTRVIACYFGPLPSYFDLWLASAGHNAHVDWLLFTDQQVAEAPANVTVVEESWASFAQRFTDHFDFAISLEKPYKICDFRPSFGDVLADHLQGYEFWGVADLDVVFGRLDRFLTDAVLDAHDKVLIRGSFSLYRNAPEVNALYLTRLPDADYRTVFADPGVWQFDEWRGVHRLLQGTGLRVWSDEVIFDISPVSYRTRANSAPRGFYGYVWSSGALYEVDATGGRREGALIHLQKRPIAWRAPAVDAEGSYLIGADAIDVAPVRLPDPRRIPPARYAAALRFRGRRLRSRFTNLRAKLRRRTDRASSQ